MALTWDLDLKDPISFAELIEYFDALGADVLKTDLDQSACVLRRLYNNRSFLVDVLQSQLADMPAFERINGYTSQVFVLHRSEHYFVRAAIWLPRADQRSDEVFLYEDAHDHNFNLLTLGYLGSGYRTVLFEYDHAAASGFLGEAVQVKFLENTGLENGRVMLFRESRDIHVQFPSDEFSISINIISTGSQHVRQYSFDLDLSPDTTVACIHRSLVGHMPSTFARFARAMEVDDVAGKLESMLSAELNGPARMAVIQALAEISAPSAGPGLGESPVLEN
jgi:hypothetical protein